MDFLFLVLFFLYSGGELICLLPLLSSTFTVHLNQLLRFRFGSRLIVVCAKSVFGEPEISLTMQKQSNVFASNATHQFPFQMRCAAYPFF